MCCGIIVGMKHSKSWFNSHRQSTVNSSKRERKKRDSRRWTFCPWWWWWWWCGDHYYRSTLATTTTATLTRELGIRRQYNEWIETKRCWITMWCCRVPTIVFLGRACNNDSSSLKSALLTVQKCTKTSPPWSLQLLFFSQNECQNFKFGPTDSGLSVHDDSNHGVRKRKEVEVVDYNGDTDDNNDDGCGDDYYCMRRIYKSRHAKQTGRLFLGGGCSSCLSMWRIFWLASFGINDVSSRVVINHRSSPLPSKYVLLSQALGAFTRSARRWRGPPRRHDW